MKHLTSAIPRAANIVMQFKEMIEPHLIYEVLECALQVPQIESLSLMITAMNDEKFSLLDI